MLRLASFAMLAVLFGLLAALLIPWKQRPVVLPEDTLSEAATLPPPETASASSSLLDPPRIASLFGWRSAPPSAVPPNSETAKPLEAPFLTALGYVTKDDGVRYYMFKDQRSQRVFSLSVGHGTDGWNLTSAGDDGFLLEFEGTAYIVRRKK